MCLEPPDMCTAAPTLGCLLGYSALDFGEFTFINPQHGETVSQTLGTSAKGPSNTLPSGARFSRPKSRKGSGRDSLIACFCYFSQATLLCPAPGL